MSFTAFRVHADRVGIESVTLDDLSPGDVVIRVHWSGINYKDALAATRRAPIVRRPPLVAGIDLAGIVESSTVDAVRAGDAVLVTGCGLSETRDGGYARFARVPAQAVVPLPDGLDLRSAMAIGTAGFAAALAITQMQAMGLSPGQGSVVVTGASGGVGALAIDMLAGLGHRVVAVTRKTDMAGFLQGLGAAAVLAPRDCAVGIRPLEPMRWAGAIDNVGGEQLSSLLRSLQEGASVAAVGLAGGSHLDVSLMPFLLRGVNLLGVNSAGTAREKRLAIWQRIATDLAPRHLDALVTRTVSLAQLPQAFDGYLAGARHGRTLVRIDDGA